MHEDGDPPDESSTTGRLFHSGIRRVDDIEPADYALPPGVPALQDEELEGMPETPQDDQPVPAPVDRRRLLAAGLGGLVIGIGSYLLGRGVATRPVQAGASAPRRRLSAEDLQVIEAARGWVDLPVQVLVDSAPSFLWVFEVMEPDPQLARGLRRLCEYALLHRGEESGYRAALRILDLFDKVPPPPGFAHYVEPLGNVVWRWQLDQERRKR